MMLINLQGLLLAFHITYSVSVSSRTRIHNVDDCTVTEDFDSPYVSTTSDVPVSVSGCDSKNVMRMSAGRNNGGVVTQVHVIHLSADTPSTQSASGQQQHDIEQQRTPVALYIKGGESLEQATNMIVNRDMRPDLDFTVAPYTQALTFVLHSDIPVTWKIHTTDLSNTTRHTFYVDRRSRLDRHSRQSPLFEMHRRALPSHQSRLLDYITDTLDLTALTSYMHISSDIPHTITRYVVPVSASQPPQCTVTNNYISPLSTAVRQQQQPVRGCAVPANSNVNNKEVHIIELEEATPYTALQPASGTGDSSSTQPPLPIVDVDVRVLHRQNRVKHIRLALRSTQPVLWQIRTERLRGDLEVFTEHEVNTVGVGMQTVQTTSEHLTPITGADLRLFILERYGPAVSYTWAPQANHFTVTIDAHPPTTSSPATTPMPPIRAPPGFSHNDGTDGPSSDNRGVSVVSSTSSRGLHSGTDEGPYGFSDHTIVHVLTRRMSVQCTDDHMHITLPTTALVEAALPQVVLTLGSTDCVATQNATHYVINRALASCNTRQIVTPDSVYYKNTVGVFIRELDLLADHHGPDVSLPVSCQYPAYSASVAMAKFSPSLTYSLYMYTDDQLSLPISLPAEVHAQRTLYVHASVTGDDKLQAVIQNCSMVTSADAPFYMHHEIVKRGCEIDKSVTWYTSSEMQRLGDTSWGNEVHHTAGEGEGDIQSPRQTADMRPAATSAPSSQQDGHVASVGAPAQAFGFRTYDYTRRQQPLYLMCSVNVCSMDVNYATHEIHRCLPQPQYCAKQNVRTDDIHHNPTAYSQMITVGPVTITPNPDPDPLGVAGPGVIGGMPAIPSPPHLNPVDSGGSGNGDSSRNHNIGGSSGGHACEQVVHVQGLDSGTVVGIAFAAFIIGVLLTAVLWFIHTHTGPLHRKQQPRSAETSGELTPCSTTHMTVHSVRHC